MNLEEIKEDVCQSQTIENIPYDEHSQLTQLHIQASQGVCDLAEVRVWPSVKKVHMTLMCASIDMAGSFRTFPVFVRTESGEKVTLPSATHMPYLMDNWEKECQIIRQDDKASFMEKENSCMLQYYRFQCIHPFEDGNGRVGRLMYNALRLCAGLPWYTFKASEYHLYLQYLRMFEQGFKKEHKDMYDLE